jgi:hypothetical protein
MWGERLMDAAVAAAITAVPFAEAGQARQWFDVVCRTRDQCGASADWDRFAAELAERAEAEGIGREIVEQFTEYLSNNDPAPVETIGRMRGLGDDLPRLYHELADGYDEAAWQAFLAENGPRWDGDERTWDQFRQWFHYEAGQHGLAVPAGQFIGHVEGQPDKVAVFAQYGVVISAAGAAVADRSPAPDVSSYPELKDGDEGEWVEYLDAMLTSQGF